MKHTSVCLLCLLLGSAWTPFASASWTSLISTGTVTGFGNPSCAPFVSSSTETEVVCAVRNGRSTLMVNEFNVTTLKWKTWKSLSGSVRTDPSCTSTGAGEVLCAATATNGNLLYSIYNGTSWSKVTSATSKDTLYSAPSCAQYTTGQVLCVARNAIGGLDWSLYNGTTWSTFASLVTSAISAPSCTTDNDGGVLCMIFTVGGGSLASLFASGEWQTPQFYAVGGVSAGTPDCTSNLTGGAICCAKGIDSGIYAIWYNLGGWPGNWSNYGDDSFGGQADDNASVTQFATGQTLLGMIDGADGNLYAQWWTGSEWTGWIEIGGPAFGSPSCTALGTGQVVCVVMGVDNELSYAVGP